MSGSIQLSVVIPLFNDEEMITLLRDDLNRSVLSRIPRCEVVLVDDGSRDETYSLLQGWAREDSRVQVLKHTKNMGQTSAIRSGMAQSSGEFVLVMDSDLQDPPALVEAMLRAIQQTGVEMIAAQRGTRLGETVPKRLTAWLYYRIMSMLLPFKVTRDAGEFRIITRTCVNRVLKHRGPIPIMRIFLDSVAQTRGVFPYERQPRAFGESHYTWKALLRLGTTTLAFVPRRRVALLFLLGGLSSLGVAQSVIPFGLRFTLGLLGVACTGVGLLCLVGRGLCRSLGSAVSDHAATRQEFEKAV